MVALIDVAEMAMVGQGIDHAEGICMTPDGSVYVSGEKGQIYRLEADDSALEMTSTGGWTLGLAADAEGRIYACDAGRRAVMRWTPGGEPPQVWTSGSERLPFVLPNWGAFAPDGATTSRTPGRGKAGMVVSTSFIEAAPAFGPAKASTSPTAWP